MITEKLLGCRVCATAAIDCRIKTLKRIFQVIVKMRGPGCSGFGTTSRFAEIFTNVGSNEPGRYEGFDMADENEEFPPLHTSDARPNKRATQDDCEWPARALANDNYVRTEYVRILREMSELTSLDRVSLQRHLLSRMDNLRGFVLMPEDEKGRFCRVLLRDMTR
ncbi:retrotransposon protein [Cucumis melo var. makuwa]|uniref:Retrotransposon protein n=1 Tax=Cucumis melo var. makuwa TaxID=1194695 RepID=A0A5D3C3E2_CUCMM|nr:retrotransposon protein [Cucumis melo var. makuwa]